MEKIETKYLEDNIKELTFHYNNTELTTFGKEKLEEYKKIKEFIDKHNASLKKKEITERDLVVGKTVLIEKLTKNEFLIIGKIDVNEDIYYETLHGEYSLIQINQYFTIKQ